MCRLFGFRSVIQSQVHRSLMSAENALSVQSEKHPDGWGVAYYVAGAPHLIKGASTALADRLFHRVSGVVSSETVLAHIRKATQGTISLVNTHPFQYGPWVFAHNGNIRDFDRHRDAIAARTAPKLRRFILGETDSEALFFLILTHLARRVDLASPDVPLDTCVRAVREALDDLADLAGNFCTDPDGPPTETWLTFLLTNGRILAAHHGGKDLFFSTHKHLCPERDTCPSFSDACERRIDQGFINHLVVSSEPLLGENVWRELLPGEIIGCDERMRLTRYPGLGLSASAI